MTTPQTIAYINMWAITATVIATSVITGCLYRITQGAVREELAYTKGYEAAMREHAPRIDRHLMLGLSGYDAREEIPSA